MTLKDRVQRLEDEVAIRALKARYLRACDLKRPEEVRDTLAPAGAIIAYEGFPPFDNRDAFVDIFTAMGCQPGVYDIHHATNGVIVFESETRARGQWSLHFKTIILANRSVTEMGVEYDDIYEKRDGRWWIVETRSTRSFFLGQSVAEDGTVTVGVMGDAPAVYGE